MLGQPSCGVCASPAHTRLREGCSPLFTPALKHQAEAFRFLVWVLRWGVTRPLGIQALAGDGVG